MLLICSGLLVLWCKWGVKLVPVVQFSRRAAVALSCTGFYTKGACAVHCHELQVFEQMLKTNSPCIQHPLPLGCI